jgi:type II secretory pathway pseudopilin PulG
MKAVPSRAPAGFTLIEVVLSIGLLAFAVTVIMAALNTAGHYSANDARRALAVDLLHRGFRDLEMANTRGGAPSPVLGLKPIAWSKGADTQRLWFDADGGRVDTAAQAFFRCDITANPDPTGAVGHLHGRVTWPARNPQGRTNGEVELFTSLPLP